MSALHRAFTLLEVLLVIALLGFLASFLWPVFGDVGSSRQLDESVERMKSLVAMCRAQAMNESRCYRLTFRLDGSIKLTRQLDPFDAPHIYVRVRDDWAATPCLLEQVWVESVLPLAEGPPPLLVEDDYIEFFDEEDLELELIRVDELEEPFELDFLPDGSSASMRWVLRHEQGHGMQVTLDGRLGRMDFEPAERIVEEEVERPPPLPEDELEEEETLEDEDQYDLEDFR
jgi:prepilin-type N-terminal cleavage/methylation domain-containing protein